MSYQDQNPVQDPDAGRNALQADYQDYLGDPTPERLGKVIDRLTPTIRYSLASIGAADDPFMHGKAKVVAAKAVQKYNPESGASIPTWVSGQLMQLRRIKRLSSMPMKIPERTQIGAYKVMQAEMEFLDEHGREPDMLELADAAKMSPRHIEKIRRIFKKMPSQTSVGEMMFGSSSDFSNEAVDYLYKDLDYADKKIMEHKTGYGGSPILSGNAIAKKLGLTATQLSRRSARLGLRLQQVEDNLRKTST